MKIKKFSLNYKKYFIEVLTLMSFGQYKTDFFLVNK